MKTRTIQLGEIMPARSGSVDPSRFPEEPFDLYSIAAYDQGQPETRLGREIGSAKQVVQPGDVLLSRIVPHIRRAWVVGEQRGRRMIASGEWMVFRGDRFDPCYLRHALVTDLFHGRFMQTVSGVGGSLLRARPAQVADIEIAMPPLPDQQRIAGQLEQADRLRRTRRYALELADTLLPAALLQLFGDPADNPRGFDRVQVEQLFPPDRDGAKCGPFGSALKKHEYVQTGVPVWTMDCVGDMEFREDRCLFVTEQKFEELRAYDAQNGDILVSRAGTVGRMAIVMTKHPRSIIHSNIIRLSLNPAMILPIYFVAVMTWFPERVARLKRGQEDAYTFMSTGTLGAAFSGAT
ncbi:MAG: restriction endonuclease subunit S [Verrucomicrobiales bacterium]|nr:restriction endonuclease subunit S [Verrucomicrobiales bacterium]